jgi:hypothetical protein
MSSTISALVMTILLVSSVVPLISQDSDSM